MPLIASRESRRLFLGE
jgi:hypothetical protein